MYVIIIGCGKVGYQLTRVLLAMGHEVLVIEKDPNRCETINEELGTVAYRGDGTDIQSLKEAGVARADVVIAVASRDEDNLATCQMAKQLYHASKTIALIKDPRNEAPFKVLGVDVTVNSTNLVLSTIEEELPGQPLVHLMNLRTSDQELVSVTIPRDAAVVGKALGDIELPPHSLISLVVKQQGPTLPSEELVLEGDDNVVAVTSADEEQLLFETLTGWDDDRTS